MQTKTKNLDGIKVVRNTPSELIYITPLATPKPRGAKALLRRHRTWLSAGVLMFISFSFGMLTVWSSLKNPAVASAESSQDIQPRGILAQDNQSKTLLYLGNQFSSLVDQYKEGQFSPAETLEQRQKLKDYLASKNSPWANDNKTIDALLSTRNMRMILAISFVESNFGKHCDHKNCSGIGVDPSSGSWRQYKSYANWVLDFDRLLERRYKNWTPEEMRGVYVNPGSDLWVNGINQVLLELQQAGVS